MKSLSKQKSPIAQAACGELCVFSESQVASLVCRDCWGTDYVKVVIRPLQWTLMSSLDLYHVVGERVSDLTSDQLSIVCGAPPVAVPAAKPPVQNKKKLRQQKLGGMTCWKICVRKSRQPQIHQTQMAMFFGTDFLFVFWGCFEDAWNLLDMFHLHLKIDMPYVYLRVVVCACVSRFPSETVDYWRLL